VHAYGFFFFFCVIFLIRYKRGGGGGGGGGEFVGGGGGGGGGGGLRWHYPIGQAAPKRMDVKWSGNCFSVGFQLPS